MALELTNRINCHQDGWSGAHTNQGFSFARFRDIADVYHVPQLLLLLNLSSYFPLSAPLTVVFAQVTVLAHSMSVLRPVYMRACVSLFLSAHSMVTVFTHTLGVEDSFDVRAFINLMLRDFHTSALLGLLRLLLRTWFTCLPHRLLLLTSTSFCLSNRGRRVTEVIAGLA